MRCSVKWSACRTLGRWSGYARFGVLRAFQARRLGPVAWCLVCALLVLLVRAGLPDAPDQHDETLLTVATLAALPWSLMLATWDLDPGFGARAAWVLAAGLVINLAAVGWCAGWLRRRWRGPTFDQVPASEIDHMR